MIIPPTPAPAHAEGSVYRLKRGTKLSDLPPLPPNPPVPDLSSLNGPFQLAEYLALKVRHDPHDVKGLVEVPTGDGSVGGKAPDKNVWIYEHLRRIPIDLTPLITALLSTCTPQSCPEMKADEWLYLCSAHGAGAEQCCAIDYILHTLDSTTALVNSSQNFPSRMQIPQASQSHFPSLFRRLSRIFSHAYYHHRETFQLAEAETSLYARFLGLCERYDLVGESLLPIPPSAVAVSASGDDDDGRGPRVESKADTDKPGQDQNHTQRQPTTPLEAGTNASPPKVKLAHAHSPLTSDKKGASSHGAVGRGTLGRGKQARATMVWGAAARGSAEPTAQGHGQGVPPLPSNAPKSPAKGRDRSESIESAIHIPSLELEPTDPIPDQALEDLEAEIPRSVSQEDPVHVQGQGGEQEEEEEVPKDEIELLEEEGILKPQSPVAPLAPAPLAKTDQPGEPGVAGKEAASGQGQSDEPSPSVSENEAGVGSGPVAQSLTERDEGEVGVAEEPEEVLEDVDLSQDTDSTASEVDVPQPETQSTSSAASAPSEEASLPTGETAPTTGKASTSESEIDQPQPQPQPKPEPKADSTGPESEPTAAPTSAVSVSAELPPSPLPSHKSDQDKDKDKDKKDKKLSPLRDRVSPSPIKGKGKPSAAEVVKSGSVDALPLPGADIGSGASAGVGTAGKEPEQAATKDKAETTEAKVEDDGGVKGDAQ